MCKNDSQCEKKTYLRTCAPSEDSDQLTHPCSLIRDFAVRQQRPWIIGYHGKLWLDCVYAQVDLNLPVCKNPKLHFSPITAKMLLLILGGHGFTYSRTWAMSREKGSLDFPSNQSFSAHAQPLSEVTCLVLWLKIPLGLSFTWANSIGSGETARTRRLTRTIAVRMCYNDSLSMTWLVFMQQ